MAASSALKEQPRDTQPDKDDRYAGCQRDNEDADGTAHQAGDHPWPPHAQPRRGAVAHPAEERITEHRHQGADPGDKRQAARCRSIPTSESTFNAKVSSTGARNRRLVLMYANVYSEMKPHPTRHAIQMAIASGLNDSDEEDERVVGAVDHNGGGYGLRLHADPCQNEGDGAER